MISRGVEISIAGGVVAIVHGLSLGRCSFFFFFFVIKSLLCLKVQKTHAALAYGDKKPISKLLPAHFTSS